MADDNNSVSTEQENTNMDWKKKGFDKHERLTLKINIEEAIRRNANKKINLQSLKKTKPLKKTSKKVKNKIKTSIYDDDEDEEEYILAPVFNNLKRFSLEEILTPKEKKQLEKMENTNDFSQPEKLQIKQVTEDHINTQLSDKPKHEYNTKNIVDTNDKNEILPDNNTKEIENFDKNYENEPISIIDKETASNISIEDILKEDEKPEEEKDMRSIILEKSGRTSQTTYREHEETEQNPQKTHRRNQNEHER